MCDDLVTNVALLCSMNTAQMNCGKVQTIDGFRHPRRFEPCDNTIGLPPSQRRRHPLTETPLKMNNAPMRMGSSIRRYVGEAPTTVRPGRLDQ
jgi:hypothetical protein